MDLIRKLSQTSRPVRQPDGTYEVHGISYSQADMYLRCPRQYYFRYIQGKKTPPAVALVEGTSHHASMEEDNLEKKHKGKALSAANLTEIFEVTLDEEMEKASRDCEELKISFDWEGENKERLLQRAKILHLDYAGKWSAKFDPVGVEDTFSREVRGMGTDPFLSFGVTDLTTKTGLWDYKTAGKAKSQGDVDNNLQLSLYSWARGMKSVGFITFVKTQNPYVQVIESKRTPGQWMWSVQVLAGAVDGIRRGSFPLTNPGAFPPPWHCNERFCGFWNQCRGKYDVDAGKPKT